jgi:hypothetical protein
VKLFQLAAANTNCASGADGINISICAAIGSSHLIRKQNKTTAGLSNFSPSIHIYNPFFIFKFIFL